MPHPLIRTERGTSMIEVLVTIVILVVGLLGLAGMQARLQISEMESYQRAQALILLKDMASRIATNRTNAASYATTAASPLGEGMSCSTDVSTRQRADFSEWCNALQGAGETAGGSKVGAMVGGRGCIEDLGANEYLVTVAWQGLAPVSVPPATVACGSGLYGGGGTTCAGDLCRRVVTTIVRIAPLL